MENSQKDLRYRRTYIRAYEMYRRRLRIEVLSVTGLVVMIAMVAIASCKLLGTCVDKIYAVADAAKIAEDVSRYATDIQGPIEDAAEAVDKVTAVCTKDHISFGAFSPAIYSSSNESLEVMSSTYLSAPVKYEQLDITADDTPVEGMMRPDVDIDELYPETVLTDEQLEFVERVVEAEVTGTTYHYGGEFVDEEAMLYAKIRVAQVFLNRARDTEKFSDVSTLYEAISQPGASSTVGSGRYKRVEVTDLTKKAVQMALDPTQEDLTDGALFFLAGGAKHCKYGDYMFTDAVGHSFFK